MIVTDGRIDVPVQQALSLLRVEFQGALRVELVEKILSATLSHRPKGPCNPICRFPLFQWSLYGLVVEMLEEWAVIRSDGRLKQTASSGDKAGDETNDLSHKLDTATE